MNLVILINTDQTDERRYVLGDHRAEHIRSILKLKVGDEFEAGLLNGPIGKARILSDDGVVIEVEIGGLREPSADPVAIHLICALPRPQTVKKVLQTIATMGVERCDFIRANRVERSFYQSPLIAEQNFMSYILEGLAQGKRTKLPEVAVHERFRPFMEDVLPTLDSGRERALRLLPDPEAAETLDKVFEQSSRVILAIGPEGGWVPFETELMESLGFVRYRLSRSILRVETAVTAALAQMELLTMRPR
ncbi:MAG TPA: RsmE family RNA methyltransferase [candidate division Zixibacteria bacterium]|nr:RsmE family RNA methyltransferase [candidate division Zixibacteria bacterium]